MDHNGVKHSGPAAQTMSEAQRRDAEKAAHHAGMKSGLDAHKMGSRAGA